MRSFFIKKIIVSSLLFTVLIGSSVLLNTKSVQATNHHFDVEYFMGFIDPIEFITYEGKNAAVIPIPNDTEYKNIFIEGIPEYLNEMIIGDNLILTGLKTGETYKDMYMVIKCLNTPEDMDYKYLINTFTFNGETQKSKVILNDKKVAHIKTLSNHITETYKEITGKDILDKDLNKLESMLKKNDYNLITFYEKLICSDDFSANNKTIEEKINKLYLALFNRNADIEGLNFWVKKYNDKLAEKNNPKDALLYILKEMTLSNEYKALIMYFDLKY